MNRALCVCGILLFGLSACTSTHQPYSIAEPVFVRYVVERDLIVRQSANAGANEVGHLAAGDSLTAWVEDVGGNWYRLNTDNGNVGYIFGMPFRHAQ
ncbi:MAG: SH3 domain-containing protein [Alphaproteobacteria bacterium]